MRVKRADRRAGEIFAILYNINRDHKEDPDGMEWQDLFPEWKEAKEPQSEDEMFNAMQMWVTTTKGQTH